MTPSVNIIYNRSAMSLLCCQHTIWFTACQGVTYQVACVNIPPTNSSGRATHPDIISNYLEETQIHGHLGLEQVKRGDGYTRNQE